MRTDGDAAGGRVRHRTPEAMSRNSIPGPGQYSNRMVVVRTSQHATSDSEKTQSDKLSISAYCIPQTITIQGSDQSD